MSMILWFLGIILFAVWWRMHAIQQVQRSQALRAGRSPTKKLSGGRSEGARCCAVAGLGVHEQLELANFDGSRAPA